MKRAIAIPPVLLAVCLAGGAALARPLAPPRSSVHDVLGIDRIDERVAPPVDVAALRAEDARHADEPGPYRVAFASALRVGLEDAGTWEALPDGDRLWRLRIRSPGAVFLSLKFSQLELPPGAELHFVSESHDYYDGPYGSRHSRPPGRFGSPMIPGDSAVIELFVPAGVQARLRLESVSHGYRDPIGMGRVPLRGDAPARTADSAAASGPGGAFGCQRDVNCPEGAAFQDVKRSVAEGYDGTYVCSGQLVNNVRQDNRYLYLTASHCEWWIDPPTMVYYWNYENSGCGTGDAPLEFSTGSTDLFHDAASDVQLLELDGTDLEGSFDVYFTGWNRSGVAPASGAAISFPSDKPKQIHVENDPITDCSPSGCSGGFGAGFWRVEAWDVGVTEGGSSGAGLLDSDQLLVGVLTGGVGTNCNNFGWDEFAKIAPVWPSLQPFLDPDATGAVALAGKDRAPIPEVPAARGWGRALLAGGLLLAAVWAMRRGTAVRRR